LIDVDIAREKFPRAKAGLQYWFIRGFIRKKPLT